MSDLPSTATKAPVAVPPLRSGVAFTLTTLFLANFLNFFDRAIPAVVLEPVRREFHLDDTALGVVGAAFTIVYALTAVPLGALADRFRRTRLLAGGVSLWSLFTLASGLATNFATFFVARIGVGVGEAACTPGASSLIADLVPEKRRSRAFAVFMLGFPLGSFAALMTAGRIAEAWGWRAAFMLAAAPGLIVTVMLLMCREPLRDHHDAASRPASGGFASILAAPFFWGISLAGVALGVAAYALGTYLPTFFIRVHGMGVGQAGGAAAIVLGLTGVVGLLGGGILADRVAVGRPDGRALLGLGACLLATPLLATGLWTGDSRLATALMAAGWTLYFLFFVTAHTTLLDRFDSDLRGRAMGLFTMLASVVGGSAGSVLAGMLSDHFAAAALAHGAVETLARAQGLRTALLMLVPGGLLVGAVGYGIAAANLRSKSKQ